MIALVLYVRVRACVLLCLWSRSQESETLDINYPRSDCTPRIDRSVPAAAPRLIFHSSATICCSVIA